MSPKDLIESKKMRAVLYTLGLAILGLGIFQAGVMVGYRKAAFSYNWGNSYYRTFGERGGGFSHGPQMMGNFLNAHGATGRIVKITLPTFIIEGGEDHVEKEILVKDNTIIRRFRDTLTSSDLKIDDFVVIIGSPNDTSQIEAKLIRLLPLPPESAPGAGTSTVQKL